MCKLIPKREGRKGAELPIVKQSSALDRVGEQSKIVFSYCLCKAVELCQKPTWNVSDVRWLWGFLTKFLSSLLFDIDGLGQAFQLFEALAVEFLSFSRRKRVNAVFDWDVYNKTVQFASTA